MPDPCEHYLKVKHDCESYVELAREVGFNFTTDKGLELIPKFVLCQFDDKYRLIADQSCKKFLR
jgi:hypothetical protein